MVSMPPAWAAEDMLQFYQEEANVVSASLQPSSADKVPATTFVVTQQDIKDSGAQTIPDALRNVPGVQVVETRTGDEEVGIRGLDHSLSNRVLVMLDGRSVMNGYFKNVVWESIPVHMSEIDRIEIVEGPASAVYGADAVSGVINIITKTAEQIQGGQVTYTGGERSSDFADLTYGKKQGAFGYKFGGGWRSMNQFQDASSLATEGSHFTSEFDYDFSKESSMSLSGGYDKFNTGISLGSIGDLDDKGVSSFVRTDYHYEGLRFRAFWNRLRENTLSEFTQNSSLNSDTIDGTVDQTIALPWHNTMVVGAEYRKNTARSFILGTNEIQQDLWSLFFEDKWDFTEHWMFMTSARVDRHPLTPYEFSPRGTLVYTPMAGQTFRTSAGTSFRDPTLIENYLNTSVTVPYQGQGYPLLNTLTEQTQGTRNLDPEKLESVDLSHEGTFGRLKTTVDGFIYKLSHVISPAPVSSTPDFMTGVVTVNQPFTNAVPVLHAAGTELGAEYVLTQWLRLFGNYTYEFVHEDSVVQQNANETPRHQANLGFRTKSGGWTTQWSAHWVDSTYWPGAYGTGPVNAYFLIDAHAGYAFSGRLNGLEAGVNVFNLLNHDQYEVSPVTQNGEIVKGRITGTVSYKF